MSDTLPYVVAGEWADQEWLDAASKRHLDGPDKEKHDVVYAIGPRVHPWGPKAHTVVVDGQPRVYPTQEAADDDLKVAEDELNLEPAKADQPKKK